MENYDVAKFMISNRGANRGSFLTGRNVYNTRIERLWREVNRVVTSHYSAIFKHVEHHGILDSTSELDMCVLHYVFLLRIALSLAEFTVHWNYHGIRTVGHSSPLALWNYGMVSMHDANDDMRSPVKIGQMVSLLFPKISFNSQMRRHKCSLQTSIH